jgi:hypothetical protein
MTGTLLHNALPAAITSTIPIFSQSLRYSEGLERNMCGEDGFGWDEHWLDQCRSGFVILTMAVVWIGLAMLAAQWWALLEVWSWVGSEWKRRDSRERFGNTEIEVYRDKKQG